MKIFKLPIVILSIFLLMGLVLLSSEVPPVIAQGNPTETPTPNPTIMVLENTIATQNVRISELEYQQRRKLEDLSFEVTKRVYYVSGIAAAVVLVVTFFGLRTYRDIDNIVKEKIRTSIDREYQNQIEEADLQLVPIWVRDDDILKPVIQRLELYKLKNISTFTFFGESLTRGITILPIRNESDEEEFQKFIWSYEDKLDPNKVAFILYTSNYRASEKTINIFPNLTLANMPATVGMAVINIGKTLHNIRNVEAK